MAEYYGGGDCIDGRKVFIRTKKYQCMPNSYIESPTGFKGIKYKCSRDGYSEIKIALSTEETKNATKKKPSLHFEKGDAIKCKKFYFIAESRRKLNCFKVAMMSGRHECSEGLPDVRVYAEIEAPFDSIKNAVEAKLLEIKKRLTNRADGQRFDNAYLGQ